jgi:hypothetical protein
LRQGPFLRGSSASSFRTWWGTGSTPSPRASRPPPHHLPGGALHTGAIPHRAPGSAPGAAPPAVGNAGTPARDPQGV